MVSKKADMNKIRQMLRLPSKFNSKLKISELTGVSHNTMLPAHAEVFYFAEDALKACLNKRLKAK
jgi:hypothetical protein